MSIDTFGMVIYIIANTYCQYCKHILVACVRRNANLGFLRDHLSAIRETVVKTTVTTVSKEHVQNLQRKQKPPTTVPSIRTDKMKEKSTRKEGPATKDIMTFFTKNPSSRVANEPDVNKDEDDGVSADENNEVSGDRAEGAPAEGGEDDDIIDDAELCEENLDDEDIELADIVVDEEHEDELDEPEVQEQEFDDYADDSV